MEFSGRNAHEFPKQKSTRNFQVEILLEFSGSNPPGIFWQKSTWNFQTEIHLAYLGKIPAGISRQIQLDFHLDFLLEIQLDIFNWVFTEYLQFGAPAQQTVSRETHFFAGDLCWPLPAATTITASAMRYLPLLRVGKSVGYRGAGTQTVRWVLARYSLMLLGQAPGLAVGRDRTLSRARVHTHACVTLAARKPFPRAWHSRWAVRGLARAYTRAAHWRLPPTPP